MDKPNKYHRENPQDLAQYIYENDPAATSVEEVIDLYPGFKAVMNHRQAHQLYLEGKLYEARKVSEASRTETGIEIHAGAKLGNNIFIDHGMGVVIGETAVVGDRVKIFHGVTLGGTGKEKGVKRHPTIEHDVEIGTNATLLGDITIGHHAKIGAGAVVLKDVPAYATAVGVPARIILRDSEPFK
ncbi:serine O-acetyltransferase EpsC [Fundicoccus culcitae]|uniref:Serine acetyltransferase n=1 Tax=Fundicoccus culcitae TaxID=2969821 RepID=A0ABY5P4Q1_9LACT|nr:serine O-acetyltransferase EpsC [Fundicoccus culcitae]UUX33388.1 serine O-acetyltransferase [Fundicoccus culcitae]